MDSNIIEIIIIALVIFLALNFVSRTLTSFQNNKRNQDIGNISKQLYFSKIPTTDQFNQLIIHSHKGYHFRGIHNIHQRKLLFLVDYKIAKRNQVFERLGIISKVDFNPPRFLLVHRLISKKSFYLQTECEEFNENVSINGDNQDSLQKYFSKRCINLDELFNRSLLFWSHKTVINCDEKFILYSFPFNTSKLDSRIEFLESVVKHLK